MRFESEGYSAGRGIDGFRRLTGHVTVGNGEQVKDKLGIQILKGEPPLCIRDGAFVAVRIAGRSKNADTFTGCGRADEDGGFW